MTCDQDTGSLYEVSSSPMGRRIRLNKKIQCEYALDGLIQTEAGRAMLATPSHSETNTGVGVKGFRSHAMANQYLRARTWIKKNLPNVLTVAGGLISVSSCAAGIWVTGRVAPFRFSVYRLYICRNMVRLSHLSS